MRPTCPVCGKLFWCDYPNLWRYKREKTYLCSWSCLRKYDERKEAKNMAYSKIRKDGTPAKKPGGKKKEEPKVELVYDPSIAEEYRREQAEKKSFAEMKIPKRKQLEVAAVLSDVLVNGKYQKTVNGTRMMLNDDRTVGFELTAREWIDLSEEIRMALEQLGVREEDPEDCTGNNGPL